MKTRLSLFVGLLMASCLFAQGNNPWQRTNFAKSLNIIASKADLPSNTLFDLNLEALKKTLQNTQLRGKSSNGSNVIMQFPNEYGKMETYRIFEAPVMHPDLAAKYPEIKSYAGQGIDDPTATLRFSLAPSGLQSIRLSGNAKTVFIEPYTTNSSVYTIYSRNQKSGTPDRLNCSVDENTPNFSTTSSVSQKNADDGILRSYRLAVSTTGEYAQFHGGTKAGAMAAINATMTRVNGIYETDFGVTMVLIANNDAVVYTNANTDPYTGSYNSQLQSTLTSVIGESNYDIGHVFVLAPKNGNAGCIGCVCVDGKKGSGFSSRNTPQGDIYDVDYVAHEMGHQFGGNHTFTFRSEGTNVQMEPGSGTTIMGYAGITGATDVQPNSDPYFHAATIQQITTYVKSTSCQTNTNTGNATPTANAGADYTIPKGTPFVLTGQGSDTNTDDALTYCWEQMDNRVGTYPSTTATSGVAFRSYTPTASNQRYFPRLETIKTGATSWQWEAIPDITRALSFRLTVRDNRAGGGGNNSDNMKVNVTASAGPFIINIPNTNVSWPAGSTQTVTWNVAGTTGNGINAANVDILLSTDGGNTYPTIIASAVPNDGSHSITVPNSQGTQNRIMVKGSGNIFFDISNTNFEITGGGTDTQAPSTPANLTATNPTQNTINLSWTASTDNIEVSGYDIYQGNTIIGTVTTTTYQATGLTADTSYSFRVKAKDAAGNQSGYSNTANATTTGGGNPINYCASNGKTTSDEYIGKVVLGTINKTSAAGTGGYSDFTAESTNLSKGNSNTITITPTWTGTQYNEGYSVWIDYNQDGDFVDTGEQVWTKAASKTTPVSGNFTVPASAKDGNTRMRVSMKYNGIPTPCESFQYGEVEDYTVAISGSGGGDNQAPSIPTGVTASNVAETTLTLSWNASSDNVAVTGYDIYKGSTITTTVSGTTANITGLTANTAYQFSVKAKDAAGNISATSTVVNVTTIGGPSTFDVKLRITFDRYPEETSWEIKNSNNQVVHSGGTYGSQADNSTINITKNLDAGCYTLVFKDVYGDGICCNYGNGSYELTNVATNAVLASGGSFTSQDTKNFCVGSASSLFNNDLKTDIKSSDFIIYPSPAKDFIMIQTNNANDSTYKLVNQIGQTVKRGKVSENRIELNNLPSGLYFISVTTNMKTQTKKFVLK